MTEEQYLKNLKVPEGMVDIILDTDTYNEIDDQFAIAYMIRHTDKFNVKGITAAPFLYESKTSPELGMKMSYEEILKVLSFAQRTDLNEFVFKGSREYLKDEVTPVDSPAADYMARLADNYSPEKPLYIVGIGAYTNIASAILKNPKMKENCVFVILGGHATFVTSPVGEFNMRQDIAAARIIFNSGAPLVHIPSGGVSDRFCTSKYELEHWLKGKNQLCDYLCENTVTQVDAGRGADYPWTKVIWDVVPIGWFLNCDSRFMGCRLVHAIVPQYDYYYSTDAKRPIITYVYRVARDPLFYDLVTFLGK